MHIPVSISLYMPVSCICSARQAIVRLQLDYFGCRVQDMSVSHYERAELQHDQCTWGKQQGNRVSHLA